MMTGERAYQSGGTPIGEEYDTLSIGAALQASLSALGRRLNPPQDASCPKWRVRLYRMVDRQEP